MVVTCDPATELTENQRQAIHVLDRPLVVTAGPGAGKTRVLTERFLHLLEQPGVGVENIVAITFTNKAANEMRERIRQRIDEQITMHQGKCAELQWRQRKRQLETAAIGTIHSFCARLLHEFPIAAGVDPNFTTLDEYTAAVMLDQAAQQAITSAIDHGSKLVAELAAAYGQATLITELKHVFNQLRSLGISLKEAECVTAQNTLTLSTYETDLHSLQEQVDALKAAVEEEKRTKRTGKTLEAAEAFLAAWDKEASRLRQEAPSVEGLPTFLAALAQLQEALPAARGKLGQVIKPLQDLLGTRSRGRGKLEAVYLDLCAQAYRQAVFKVLHSLEFLYTEAKNKSAALDFEDLQLRVRELLASEGIRRRVRERYRHFLVDEFQDTNRLQRDILNALGLDTLTTADTKGNRTFFFVGDRKQSIYAFRGAEVEVFDETIESVTAKGGQHLRLEVNFRSDPRLVNFFNAMFCRIMVAPEGSQPTELRQSGFVAHEPGVAFRPPLDTGQPAVVFLYTEMPKGEEKPSPYDKSPRDIEAERLAGYVRKLVEQHIPLVNTAQGTPRPPTYRDIAFLFGALTDAKTYERALRRAGVPCYVVAGHGFYGRPEVSDLLNLLAFLDNRADDIALAGVLRSPLFGLSDETLLWLRWAVTEESDRWESLYSQLCREARQKQAKLADGQRTLLEEAAAILEELLAVRNRLPLPELIEQAIRRTGYDIVCAGAEDGPQRLSNLDKLVALARSFASHGTHLLRDFVAYVREFRRLAAREAEAQLELGLDAVALLTIHKSKGLEFPIVVLPDLQRRWRQSSGKFVFERTCGLGFDIPDSLGRQHPTALKSKVLERLERREQFERMRQLYVAMTRAQDMLILSAATSAKTAAAGSARSFLDWLAPLLLPGEVAAENRPAETGSGAKDVSSTEVRLETYNPETGSLAEDGRRTIVYLDQAEVQVFTYGTGDTSKDVPSDSDKEPPSPEAFAAQPVHDARCLEQARQQLRQKLQTQLKPVLPDPKALPGRYYYSVTQLVNFANCPRQYYFARLLHPLEGEEGGQARRLAGNAECPEREARLSPSLRGLIVHRLCEELKPEDRNQTAVRAALRQVVAMLRAEGELEEVTLTDEAVIQEVWPLAWCYAKSEIRAQMDEILSRAHQQQDRYEVWSERQFVVRCDPALVTGVIDKVLITPHSSGEGVTAHVVDFKTNFFKTRQGENAFETELAEKVAQYRLQLQAYALALWTLRSDVREVQATLYFLAPNHRFKLPAEQVEKKAAENAVVKVVRELAEIRTLANTDFRAIPGARCLVCRYAPVCADAIYVAS